MRGSIAIAGVLWVGACAAGAPSSARWMPRVGVDVQAQRVDRRWIRPDIARRGRAQRWELRVGARVGWTSDAPPAPWRPPVAPREPAPRARSAPPCRAPRLCAWERRARLRALARWRDSNGGMP